MSATREITLWCDRDGCAEWVQFNSHDSEGGKSTVARAKAQRIGWTWNRKHGDWCPECSGNKPPLKAY